MFNSDMQDASRQAVGVAKASPKPQPDYGQQIAQQVTRVSPEQGWGGMQSRTQPHQMGNPTGGNIGRQWTPPLQTGGPNMQFPNKGFGLNPGDSINRPPGDYGGSPDMRGMGIPPHLRHGGGSPDGGRLPLNDIIPPGPPGLGYPVEGGPGSLPHPRPFGDIIPPGPPNSYGPVETGSEGPGQYNPMPVIDDFSSRRFDAMRGMMNANSGPQQQATWAEGSWNGPPTPKTMGGLREFRNPTTRPAPVQTMFRPQQLPQQQQNDPLNAYLSSF